MLLGSLIFSYPFLFGLEITDGYYVRVTVHVEDAYTGLPIKNAKVYFSPGAYFTPYPQLPVTAVTDAYGDAVVLCDQYGAIAVYVDGYSSEYSHYGYSFIRAIEIIFGYEFETTVNVFLTAGSPSVDEPDFNAVLDPTEPNDPYDPFSPFDPNTPTDATDPTNPNLIPYIPTDDTDPTDQTLGDEEEYSIYLQFCGLTTFAIGVILYYKGGKKR